MRRAGFAACILAALLTLAPLPGVFGVMAAPAHHPTPVTTTIYLVPDQSLPAKVVSDAEIAATAQALTDWANTDLDQAWGLPATLVVAVPRGAPKPPKSAWYLRLMSTTDVWGALGYHTESQIGVPWGEVGVEDAVAYDGNWTICVSHELAEMLVNPYTNYFALDGSGKVAFAREVGDPVEAHSYWWGDRGVSYRMSDYVYPSYFTPGARYPFDKLHLVTRPFGVLQDGYQIVFNAGPFRQLSVYHSWDGY